MAKPELGTKRTCPECEARFYDLGKMPCECPKCEHSFEPEILLKSKKRVVEAEKPKPKPKPAEAVSDDDDDEEETGVEEVTAEGMVKMPAEVDEDGLAVAPGDGDDDDEVAEINADLATNDDDDDNEDDNTTLVNFDDDEDDVAATIVPDLGKTKDE